MTKRIAILGANGQVGTEVCLHLSRLSGIELVPIVRTEPGTAFLRRMGLDCVVGSVGQPEIAARLAACDAVADFSLPRGIHTEVRKSALSNVAAALEACGSKTRFVFISTTMAFGMPATADRYHSFTIARTAYASEKRAAEGAAMRLGRRLGLDVFVLRLGQVHGALQRISDRLQRMLARNQAVAVAAEPQDLTDAVFCTTIAKALENIGRGADSSGIYTLVEQPDWTCADLFNFYLGRIAQPVEILWRRGPAESIASGSVVNRVFAVFARASLLGTRELLLAHAVPLLGGLEPRLRARHLVESARTQMMSVPHFDPSPERQIKGPVPGRRLPSLAGVEGPEDRGFDWLEGYVRDPSGSARVPSGCSE
jgi:nucleoside-diphosphate-sugar epimerase